MALIINHNMPAMAASRNLSSIYGSLGKSIERLSSGLRINRAADDAAGLAVREMMRADIASTLQGIRNAADAVSLIQTADGALAVIDAKLIRMKELATQAATGTYTTSQRNIINSEFQAMAQEIDRIANATNFNGIRLLDGSLNTQNGGEGLRIHFGPSNTSGEDYYYIRTDDTRATSTTGLGLSGDSINDVWGTGGGDSGLDGCCGGAFASTAVDVMTDSAMGFAYAYNWDANANFIGDNGQSMIDFQNAGRYLAGNYGLNNSGMSLEDLIEAVNEGTQSRGMIKVSAALTGTATAGNYAVFCLGSSEAYYFGSASAASAAVGKDSRTIFQQLTTATASGLAALINTCSKTYWAMTEGDSLIVFTKSGGNFDNTELGYVAAGPDAGKVVFTNIATGQTSNQGTKLSYGGLDWASMSAVSAGGTAVNVKLSGNDVGDGYDLKIANSQDTGFLGSIKTSFSPATATVNSKLSDAMLEIQDAANGRGSIRTQETAQTALEDINRAIERKDVIRAGLGATQNRLEATIENLTVQAENLQAAESRISDVDVATEMTEFTKQNVLAQAAAAMLAQANSLSMLALTLLQ